MLKKYFTNLSFARDFFKTDRELTVEKRSENFDTMFLQLSPFFNNESYLYDEGTMDLLAKRENLERESKK